MASLLPTRQRRRVPAPTTLAVVALAAMSFSVVACSSTDAASPGTSSSTTSPSTSTTTPDPGPGPTSLEGVEVNVERIVGPATPGAAGLDSPTAVAPRPGRNQLWIAERSGQVRVLSVDTTWDRTTGRSKQTGYTLLTGEALDLSSLTSVDGERGLLGLAFSSDGRTLYVDHTTRTGDISVAAYDVVDKSTFSGGTGAPTPRANAVVGVDPASRRELLTIPHRENSNHNGGQLALGPDGFLYIGVGDGGGSGDPAGNAQNPESLLGKVLRIDPASPGIGTPYALPADNPFAAGGGRAEIFLTGVRNPWRFSFDRANGDLWLADVGQNTIEEVDWLPASTGGGRGANLGWNWFEGDDAFRTDGDPPTGTVEPILTYGHDGGRCSVTGGYVYRGAEIPDLVGTYVYADYCTGEIRGLLARNSVVLDDRPLGVQFDANTLVSFAQDDDGELYVVASDGELYKVGP